MLNYETILANPLAIKYSQSKINSTFTDGYSTDHLVSVTGVALCATSERRKIMWNDDSYFGISIRNANEEFKKEWKIANVDNNTMILRTQELPDFRLEQVARIKVRVPMIMLDEFHDLIVMGCRRHWVLQQVAVNAWPNEVVTLYEMKPDKNHYLSEEMDVSTIYIQKDSKIWDWRIKVLEKETERLQNDLKKIGWLSWKYFIVMILSILASKLWLPSNTLIETNNQKMLEANKYSYLVIRKLTTKIEKRYNKHNKYDKKIISVIKNLAQAVKTIIYRPTIFLIKNQISLRSNVRLKYIKFNNYVPKKYQYIIFRNILKPKIKKHILLSNILLPKLMHWNKTAKVGIKIYSPKRGYPIIIHNSSYNNIIYDNLSLVKNDTVPSIENKTSIPVLSKLKLHTSKTKKVNKIINILKLKVYFADTELLKNNYTPSFNRSDQIKTRALSLTKFSRIDETNKIYKLLNAKFAIKTQSLNNIANPWSISISQPSYLKTEKKNKNTLFSIIKKSSYFHLNSLMKIKHVSFFTKSRKKFITVTEVVERILLISIYLILSSSHKAASFFSLKNTQCILNKEYFEIFKNPWELTHSQLLGEEHESLKMKLNSQYTGGILCTPISLSAFAFNISVGLLMISFGIYDMLAVFSTAILVTSGYLVWYMKKDIVDYEELHAVW